MLHVPLDSTIESVIAVGGVLLWVSSGCWDGPASCSENSIFDHVTVHLSALCKHKYHMAHYTLEQELCDVVHR